MNYLQKELYDRIQSDPKIFDFLQESCLDGLWYWDLTNPTEEWMNGPFWKTLGYDPDKMPHKAAAWQDIIFPEDLELAKQNVGKHLSDPSYAYDQIVRYLHKDGHTVYIHCKGLAIRDENGAPIRMLGAHTDVTESYQKQKLLEESASLARVGSWQVNIATKSVWWSSTTRKIHGVPDSFEPDLSTGISFYKEGEHRDKIATVVDRAMKEGGGWDEELVIVTANGDDRWVRAVGKVEHAAGKPVRIYGVFQDIHDRKRAEQLLERSEEQFRKVFEQGTVGMAIFDKQGTFLRVNDAYVRILERPADALIGTSFTEVIHPDDLEREMQTLHKIITGTKDSQSLSFRLLINEKIKHMEGGVTVLRDEQGDPELLIVQVQDVTERRRAVDSLARSERQFRTVFESAGIGMAVLNSEHQYLKVNQAFCDILKISDKATIPGKELKEVIVVRSEGDHETLEEFMQQPEQQDRVQLSVSTSAGEKRQVLIDLIPMEGLELGTLQYMLQMRDITQTLSIQNRLEQERHFLETLIDNIPINVYVKDLESRKTLVNAAELRHLGKTDPKDLIGKSDYDLFPKWSADLSRQEDIEVFTTGEALINRETVNPDAEGNMRYFLSSKIPLRDEDGKITGLLGLSYDVTSDRLSQERLRQLSILESKSQEMEQFAYIASHDLREPLLTIKGYSDVLLEDFDHILGDEGRSYLQAIVRGANRMDDLIKGMLDYSRLAQVKEFEEVDTYALVQEVVEDLSGSIEKNKATILTGTLPILPGNRLRLKQLFQNLIANGIKFRKPEVDPEIRITCKQIAGGFEFSVLDNGIGVHERDYDKIFSLFKQLHRRNKDDGTGIGLANCKKVVEMHNGEIRVESKEFEYANFIFTIKTL